LHQAILIVAGQRRLGREPWQDYCGDPHEDFVFSLGCIKRCNAIKYLSDWDLRPHNLIYSGMAGCGGGKILNGVANSRGRAICMVLA